MTASWRARSVGHVGGRQPPRGQALASTRRGLGSRLLGGLALAPRGLGIDPGRELRGVETVEQQQQVAPGRPSGRWRAPGRPAAALSSMSVDGETGLAGAGHADDEAVGQQVGGVELQAARAACASRGSSSLPMKSPLGIFKCVLARVRRRSSESPGMDPASRPLRANPYSSAAWYASESTPGVPRGGRLEGEVPSLSTISNRHTRCNSCDRLPGTERGSKEAR